MSDSELKLDVIPLILAGGQGTRFWPLSTRKKPKQFLSPQVGGKSLLQLTADRISPLMRSKGGDEQSAVRYIVVTHQSQHHLVEEHLPDAMVVAEPVMRNTAASIGLGAIAALSGREDALLVVLPSDHLIQDEREFQKCVCTALAIAQESESLVTIGIYPTHPHTGYGYIERGDQHGEGVFEVFRFVEKPSLIKATEYLESGTFFWNSGMFVWKASSILRCISQFLPELYSGLSKIRDAWNTPLKEEVIAEVFEKLPSISIDFGVLEHAKGTKVVSGKGLGWSDIGSWDSWGSLLPKDELGNHTSGDCTIFESTDCIVVASSGKHISVYGARNLVVVDCDQAVLVVDRNKVQEIGKLVELHRRAQRDELL